MRVHLNHLACCVQDQGILRHSPWDALLVALAIVQGAVFLAVPTIPTIALGLWWNANTIAHNFIHLPFFRGSKLNAAFSLYLSLLQGIPQTLWRDRHLAHHADRPWHLRLSRPLIIESAVIATLWTLLVLAAPEFFFRVYLVGFLSGLGLCSLQGHYEHAHGTTSHYGSLYNRLFFNDGYHVEHHGRPAVHWKRLPTIAPTCPTACRYPAVLRWLEQVNLNRLERLVLKSTLLQRFVINRHQRAFRVLLAGLPPLRHVVIVGGGLFPRTALILQRLAPHAQLTIVESDLAHIKSAAALVDTPVRFIHRRYDPAAPTELPADTDLLVIPLAFQGDRQMIYTTPPARHVLIHDWIWRHHDGPGTIVSLLLLKRLNLLPALPAEMRS